MQYAPLRATFYHWVIGTMFTFVFLIPFSSCVSLTIWADIHSLSSSVVVARSCVLSPHGQSIFCHCLCPDSFLVDNQPSASPPPPTPTTATNQITISGFQNSLERSTDVGLFWQRSQDFRLHRMPSQGIPMTITVLISFRAPRGISQNCLVELQSINTNGQIIRHSPQYPTTRR